AADYFLSGWFLNDKLDEDERHIKISSHAKRRKERFNVTPQYDIDVNPASDLGELPDALAAA
ncbi:hypothetical protein QBC46DRAFT_393941, partial [Diplogelasinospora grovesii]